MCLDSGCIIKRRKGHSKLSLLPLLPFVEYDSFLIYLVNSQPAKKKKKKESFYIMEMTEWVIIFHIFITADIGPPDTVLHLTIVLGFSFRALFPLNGRSRL